MDRGGSGVTAPAYRYLLCDLLTDRLLAVLPLTGVSFSRSISRTGSLSATLTAPTPGLVNTAKLVYAYAGRSALWVERDGQLWWGGIPWTVQPKQDARGAVECSIQAATFDSYAHHRLLDVDKHYAGTGQGIIVADLWDTIQADPRGDIRVDTTHTAATYVGMARDRDYLVSDQKYVGQLIEELGDVIDGPEHTIDVFYDADGNRVKRLRVGDRIGLTAPRAVFQRVARGGGRIVSWGHTADATSGGTVFQTRGDAPNGNVGEDVQPLLSDRVYALDLLAQGWPLLDMTEDHAGVIDVGTLNGYAQALAQESAGAVPTSDYTVEVGNSGWSPNRLGDAVRLKLTDDWHDNADLTVRPVACTVTVAEKGQPEQIALSFSQEAA